MANTHDSLFRGTFARPTKLPRTANGAKDDSPLIYVLFEHWSNPYPPVPVRVLKYEARIMETYGDAKTGRYPAVVAIVLCHSKGGEAVGLDLNVAPGAPQTGPQPFHHAIVPSPQLALQAQPKPTSSCGRRGSYAPKPSKTCSPTRRPTAID